LPQVAITSPLADHRSRPSHGTLLDDLGPLPDLDHLLPHHDRLHVDDLHLLHRDRLAGMAGTDLGTHYSVSVGVGGGGDHKSSES
jgi:hypothetical protein